MNLEDIAAKAFQSSSAVQNYKELYEETKKNVALFISQVDAELAKILSQHQKETLMLKKENQALRQQIKAQSHLVTTDHSSVLKDRKISNSDRLFSHQKMRDFTDCNISQIALTQSKTVFVDKKRSSIISYILSENDQNFVQNKKQPKYTQRSSSISNYGKQNQWNEEKSELLELKQKLGDRKRSRMKNNVCLMSDQQSVKDVLKNLRQKVNTPVNFDEIMRKQAENLPKNILSPAMFMHKPR